MSESKSTENVQTALGKIEAGIKSVRESGRFAEYLAFCSKFHKYSVTNQMLIFCQKPDAQMVAGFHRWLELKRYVRKGEKGIMILAPMMGKKQEAEEGEEDKPARLFFKGVYVFDVSQTEGEDLPAFAPELAGEDSAGNWNRLMNIASAEGLTLSRETETTAANGWYSRSRHTIWIDPNLSPLQSVKTLAHELSHHFANHPESQARGEKEMVAESSAYVVMNHLGLSSDSYSFDYLASWGDDKTFRAALNEIIKTANIIIERLAA